MCRDDILAEFSDVAEEVRAQLAEKARLAEEKAAKNRKCCACGSRGEEAGKE